MGSGRWSAKLGVGPGGCRCEQRGGGKAQEKTSPVVTPAGRKDKAKESMHMYLTAPWYSL
jgi:hypothetical protein